YSRYYNLSEPDKTAVVVLAVLLSPDELIGKIFFPVPDGHPMLGGSSNNFYKLTDHQTISAIAPSGVSSFIMMQGKQVQVTDFMVFGRTWIINNFINPIKDELWRLKALEQADSRPARQQITYQRPASSSSSDCCSIL